MFPSRGSICLLVAAALATPVAAAERRIVLPSGSLADALAALGKQADIDIGGSDAALARTMVQGFSSTDPPARLLERLLRNSGFRAQPLPGGAFRIVRGARPGEAADRNADRRGAPRLRAARPPNGAVAGDIVVLAGKREQFLSDYPGGTFILRSSDDAFGPVGSGGAQWLLSRTPVLQSTELGAGRNKLFIRGIADSSFTGPTQATVSTYYGGVRIGYSGPDPNLNLYDIETVEVLEGPQGTLYGAGSIGGIILLNPRAPALDRAAGSAEVGLSGTRNGGLGYDSAAMVNLAPWKDRLAIRLVGYRSRESGYIGATGIGRDLNSLTQSGGRLAVRARPLDGLTIDASYILQDNVQPDLQYANPGVGRLSRLESLRQPFTDHFRMARLVAEQKLGRWTLGVAAGRINHDTDQRYDATRPGATSGPVAYDEAINIVLTTVEAHLSRRLDHGGSWLIGYSGVWDTTSAGRTFGLLSAPRELIGVSNRTLEQAGYGEYTLPIGSRIKLTVGGRYTSARMDGEPSRVPVNADFIRGQTSRRFDPEIGFTVPLSPRLQWFAQYTQGFRTGGLAVARGAGRVATFQADNVSVAQSGLRLFREGETGLAGYAAISYAGWKNIQADLVSITGFPFTANVGDGRILTFEAAADWALVPSVRLKGAIVLNSSRLLDPRPEFVSSGSRPLPASPAVTATGRITWAHRYGGIELRGDAHLRYVGSARLGVGPVLDIPYGNYTQTGAIAAIGWQKMEASLGIENLLDTQGDRFAIGNPFAVALRNEATPLRPRTVRVGLSTRF